MLRLTEFWVWDQSGLESKFQDSQDEGQKAGEDLIERGTMFQHQQAPELGSFCQMVLALDLQREEGALEYSHWGQARGEDVPD